MILVGFKWLGKYTEGRLASIVVKDDTLVAVVWHPQLRWITKPLDDVEPQYPTGHEK